MNLEAASAIVGAIAAAIGVIAAILLAISYRRTRAASEASYVSALEARHSMELAALQSREIEKIHTNAIQSLVQATNNVDNAVILIGELVLVKVDGNLTIRSVQPELARRLQSADLSDPEAVNTLIADFDKDEQTADVSESEGPPKGGSPGASVE